MSTAANAATHGSLHASDTNNRIADTRDTVPTLKSWIDENLKEPNQRIFDLWHGPNDYIVRVVVDTDVVAMQPANITLKATIGDISTSKVALKALNFTARHESSSLKTSTGTKLQFGYDVTKSDKSKRADYSRNNEPIMDLISIEALGEGAIDRLRTEFKLEKGQPLSGTAVMQEALSLGGNIRWRRVWEDPKTGEKSGIDVMLTMKSEVSANVGVGKANGLEGKAELEVSVRFFGAIANTLDIHQLEDVASKALAKMWFPLNGKDSDLSTVPRQTTVSGQLAGGKADNAQIVKQGWVGCEKTQKQLIMGWHGKTGQTVVMDDAGTVLGRYDQGVTKAQIADTMANPNSQLYMKGSDLPKMGGASKVDAQIVKQGWVGCEKTQKQLIMGWDGKTGQTVVMDDAGTVLGRYDQGVTKAQIADTMANPNSQLYMKGSDLRLSMSSVPVSLSAAPIHNLQSGQLTGLSAAIDPASNRVQILNNNQLVAELKSGATLDNAQELIAMGTFNTRGQQAVKSIAALGTTTPDSSLAAPRLRMA